MGNELLTQSVGTTPATSATTMPMYNNFGFNNGISTSLFNMGLNGKNYSNDMMMPDWLKTGNITEEQRASIFGPMYSPQSASTQAQYTPQPAYPAYQAQLPVQQSFGNQPQIQQQYSQEQLNQYYNELLAKNPNLRITEKGNVYEVSNSGKKTGIFAGLVAGLGSGIVKLFKGGSLAKAFSLKSLAVKLPVLGIAGWAVGSLIDTISNSMKAKQADAQVQV